MTASGAAGRLAVAKVERSVSFPVVLHAQRLVASAGVSSPVAASLAPVHQDKGETKPLCRIH